MYTYAVYIHKCSLHWLWINLVLIKFGSKTIEQNNGKNKSGIFVLLLLTSSTVVVSKSIVSVWRKNRFWSIDLPLANVFTILNCCELEFLRIFGLRMKAVILKFSILSNVLDLEWCLPNRWKIYSPPVCHVNLPRWKKVAHLVARLTQCIKHLGAVYVHVTSII